VVDTNREQLQFERLLADLSATFVSLPAEDIDAHIEDTLRQVVEFLGFDRGTLFRVSDEAGFFYASHCWARPGYRTHLKYFAEKEFPYICKLMERAQGPLKCLRLDDLPPEAHRDKEYLAEYGLHSVIGIPLLARGKAVGFISLGATQSDRSIPEVMVDRMMLIGTIIAGALERNSAELALKQAFREVRKLKDQIQAENLYLQKEVKLIHHQGRVIGQSEAIKKVLHQVEQVSGTDSTVLILGETGTGKEMVAWTIHALSPRKNRTMVCVNCAGLPPTLIESELFGHEKGAFTGAIARQAGRFEVADGSTIFLDEIGDLPLEVQAKLLRVLQDGGLERLGSHKSLKVDVRVVAATNRELSRAVQEERFREDLYYRLNVFPITVPPLRERPEDIPLLAGVFAEEFSRKMRKTIERISRKDIQALQAYSWPGNIRELRNVIERAVILADSPVLRIHVPEQAMAKTAKLRPLADTERQHIIDILEETGWRISGERGAAKILDLNPKTLESKMKKLGIRRPYS
jgi:transcriptional regulator with GAF, ATPase, and Fis domain